MKETVSAHPVRVERLDGGAIWRITLARPKANILDDGMVGRLTEIFEEAAEAQPLKCLLVEGEGPHFSFGASVEEHLPGAVDRMLPKFHRMFRRLFDSQVFSIAVVRGQCLGGGLELASFCHRVVAAPTAKFGQPEIVLGVFAPVASVMLAERVGRPRAEHLCVTGQVVGAEEALAWGLADEIADDPYESACAYARKHLLPRSAASLRHAVWAVREPVRPRVEEVLHRVEKIYLEALMSTKDAEEGLRAFLQKRDPEWSDS